ncbi:MAG TPA: hypothetical protein VF746_05065 [Longimicrobium sp.]|jgi:hypothetical protein
MKTTRFRLAPAAAVLALLAGCTIVEPEPPGEARPTHQAVVYGTVTGPDGAPSAGARVLVIGDRFGNCPASEATYLDLPGDLVTADADGKYRGEASVFLDVAQGCVRVIASPPPGIVAGDVSVSAGPVRFGLLPPDSVRVDVTLPPR